MDYLNNSFQPAQQEPYFIPGVLTANDAERMRNFLVLNSCKWDPQVGDINTLAAFPLVLRENQYRLLANWSESLSRELFDAENEICETPHLLSALGLPNKIRSLLSKMPDAHASPAATRVLRFDFHFTTEGWKLSEVNSDVPGGFGEATIFTKLMAEHFPEYSPSGSPGEVWAEKMAKFGSKIALLSAPGYMEDYQVISYLASCLKSHNCQTYLANPAQIVWDGGKAQLQTRNERIPLDSLVRFFQAEWLPLLPKHVQWHEYFIGGLTPIANPGISVISESKRLPLVWNELSSDMQTWRSLLPETRRLQDVPWRSDESWILKTAYSNTGDTVSIREFLTKKQWSQIIWETRIQPNSWLAQKRFAPIAIETPIGELFPCLGVYTIDGVAAGIYGRLGIRPWIDFSAIDVPVLIERRES